MIFWVLISLLTALSLLVLLKPLLNTPKSAPANTAESDLAVYKDQLSEIERDLNEGNLGESQAETARIEIQRRILNTSQEQSSSTKGMPLSSAGIKAVVGLLTLAFPLGGLVLYLELGQPGMPSMPLAARDIAAERSALAEQQNTSRNEEMMGLAQKLEARLHNDPTNLEGWMLLGSTYAEIGAYSKAENSFRQAMENTPPSAIVYGAVAEMMVARADGQVAPEARALFQKTLDLNPEDPRGLFYSGLALSQVGENDGALKLWLKLRQLTFANDPWLQVLDTQISDLASRVNKSPSEIIASNPAKAPPIVPTQEQSNQEIQPQPGPTAEEMASAAELSAEDRNEMINGMVNRLADKLNKNPDDFNGWLQLIRSYHTLGRVQEIAPAFANAENAALQQPDVQQAQEQIIALKQELGF
ncbi:c-type cytochrome biogenesis protein CcmI [Kiloniella antarctica]|uniref:C-type cytochrome biogenesis protein CcmI n=1 Tax=Kiloniella antarctica TaxID=1550907 RepID=A0ABW5BI31_9PROT